MKRYLLILVALLVMVVGVQGLALDFQNPGDFSAQVTCLSGSCTWVHNTSGGNSMVQGGYFISQTPLVMTYSAATFPVANPLWECSLLYDSSLVQLGAPGCSFTSTNYQRVEMKVEGGVSNWYTNGVLTATGGAIAQNPHYVSWTDSTGGFVDDIVWGDTESRYVFGMPESGYFLQKDILNPAASGFYRVNQTDPNGTPTLITSGTFTSTFSKPNGNNQSVVLSSPTGGAGLTYDTGTAYAGVITWNLSQFFSQSITGYGLYNTEINPQPDSPGFATSDWIPYIGSGANIQFDKNSYAVGETATLTVTVSDSYYTVVTAPHVKIQDIYGTTVQDDTAIVFTHMMSGDWVGTSTYTWTSSNAEGVYFGLIYATYGGSSVLMNYDTADLTSNLIIDGYVKDAETTNVIAGAAVNVTQGSTTDYLTSAADGNYSTVSVFSASAPTTIVASKTGYETYSTTFTPLIAGEIQINLTLMPTSPTFTGIAVGGIARTPPYNRTIDSATVTIQNSTTTYTVTTNSAGYYIKNSMLNNILWDIWGSKSGFANSTIYKKLVVGI